MFDVNSSLSSSGITPSEIRFYLSTLRQKLESYLSYVCMCTELVLGTLVPTELIGSVVTWLTPFVYFDLGTKHMFVNLLNLLNLMNFGAN